jgi:hypothetical protein
MVNENKKFTWQILLAIALLPTVDKLVSSNFLSATLGQVLVYILAPSLVVFYSMRFWSKSDRWDFLEILKLLAILQFAVLFTINLSQFRPIGLMILLCGFLTSKTAQTQKKSNIVRNIITGILAIQFVFLIVFSFIKASEADKQTVLAVQSKYLMEAQEQAMNQRLDKFELQLDSLQNELRKCRNGE